MSVVVEPVLIYLFIGSVIWLVIDGLGIIRATVVMRSAHAPVSGAALTIATVAMIVFWPLFTLRFLKWVVLG